MSDHLNELPPAAALLGREVISVDAQTGEIRLKFLARADFTNRHGTVMGGMLSAMLDSATGNAIMARLPADETAVTVRLDTTFVKPAKPGPLFAIARAVRKEAGGAEAEARIEDESGQIFATAKAEFRNLKRRNR